MDGRSAAGKIVEETTPEGAVSQIQLDLDDVAELALFVAPGNEDLASMVARKATQKELDTSPVLQEAFLIRFLGRRPMKFRGMELLNFLRFGNIKIPIRDEKGKITGFAPVTGLKEATKLLVQKAKSYAPNGNPVVGRTATIVLGPPASGKSSLAEKIATDIKAAIVDPDDAKIFMAEYDGGLGAAAVHEESSHLTFGLGDNKGVAYEIIKEGFNVVIPKVGAKREA